VVAVNVLLAPLFVAHAEHFQMKRLGMAQGGALGAPGGIGIAIGELDQVQRILNVRLQLVQGAQLAGIELAGHAAIQNRQRLRADVFAQLKVFVEAQAEGLVIVRRGAMN
jgi:hypothetical protein